MQQKKKIQPILWLTLVENDVVKTRKLQKVKLDSNSKKLYNIVLLKIVLLLLNLLRHLYHCNRDKVFAKISIDIMASTFALNHICFLF